HEPFKKVPFSRIQRNSELERVERPQAALQAVFFDQTIGVLEVCHAHTERIWAILRDIGEKTLAKNIELRRSNFTSANLAGEYRDCFYDANPRDEKGRGGICP